MKRIILSVIVASGVFAGSANAEPVKLTKEQLDRVVAGAINLFITQTNGGGNTPKGNANGVPTVTTALNPAGSAPPGQNK